MSQRLITHLRHVDLEGPPEQYVVRLRQASDKRVDLIAFEELIGYASRGTQVRAGDLPGIELPPVPPARHRPRLRKRTP